ncbi:Protein xmas-2 [Ooceraea biroi]|uniref:Germinal-center associated nuclear protein n=1 Tax=Ooceraea biroi TaxID=2015173 RepID=A0A026WG31_OOCBI|nr:Protein xmas-2 [Ooceraea biroi]
MDKADVMEIDDPETNAVSNPYVFSKPSIVSDSPTIVNFGVGSDHVFDVQFSKRKDTFTFAAPMIISQYDQSHANLEASKPTMQKPKNSSTKFKPTVNVFANALKDTGAFEELKKNAKSHNPKVNIDHSITCSDVPKALLTKTAAQHFFMSFGNIAKITIRPRRRSITVTYKTKKEAITAYKNCGNYMDEEFHIEWTKLQPLEKLPTKKKDVHKNLVTNLLKATNDEIRSELKAMTNLEYNLHPNKRIEASDKSLLLPLKTKASSVKTTLSSDKSLSKLEKAVVKTEKLDSDGQLAKPLSNTSIEELENVVLQAALTAEDKYKILEARDRLMRLKRVKPASLATAKVTSGTCPDMCPEKERLMRESQRQIAPYEQLEGNEYKVNHVVAIKQYSRSSADQEEPMPHELRPVKSLKMTMSYLLHEIADLCEQEGTNLAEWYHFLWDRMRGIRKDITQQELCCADSVELVEQCARFHIISSERLCAEDASVFDKKINSENLTKCLQTLKYMYHDLRMKGITCENEPEFRAYVVLLNLNNGNFLYDLQQLPKYVQNSPEVQFAIKVYFSLDSNNYYKFFKLVRETTYLKACILLRYFNQVRLKAFSIMIKAYCRSTSTAFPLYEMMDILGFEDENEARYFCEQVGLNVSDDDLYVLLNRRNFSMPTTSIQQVRACNLIESKRIALNFSIGQCIAGKRMPERIYKNHKPHNSFDAHGYLKPESINAADQNADALSAEQHDACELMEKKMKPKPKLIPIRGKNQRITKEGSPVNPVQIKKQPASAGNESNMSKTVTDYRLITSDGVKTTSEPISVEHETRVPNIFENKSYESTAQVKESFDKKFDDRDATTNKMNRENTTMDNKKQPESFSSNNTFGNNTFASSSTKQQETLRNVESATPFATAVNKSIFSGTATGNIFMKNAMSSSTVLFGNPVVSTSVSSQQSANNVDAASKVKKEQIVFPKKEEIVFPKKERTVFAKKEQNAQKDVQAEIEKVRLEKLEHAKKMQRLDEQSGEIYNSLHAEITQEFCSAVVKEDIDRIKTYNALSDRILHDITEDVTYEMCDDVLTAEVDNQRKLEAMLLKVKNRVILKSFNNWKRYVAKRKRQREALEDTPVWVQKQSVEECAKMLYSKEQEVVIRSMRRRRKTPEDVTISTEVLAPIEVIAHIGIRENLRLLDINPLPNLFWKLVISWPDLSSKTLLWHHKKVMNEYLYPVDFTVDPIVKVYQPNPYETLHICIRHFEGLISEHNLTGADALLFIADASENYKSVAKRLMRTVLSRHKLMPMPLAFITLGNGDLEKQNEGIISNLESILESGYISEYTIMHEKNLTAKVILNLTQSAVLWLTMNKSPSNPLEMDYLYNVYDICLSEELWLRILGDSTFNKQLSNALADPNFVIDLHNEAVNHLIDIILDPESMLYTNFAPELKKFVKSNHSKPCSYEYFDESWKRDEYRARLENTMNSFLLPPWNAPWPITDVQDLRRHIMNYCGEVLSDSNCNTIFCDILSNLFLTSGSLQVSNFVHILLHILKEKVRLLDENQTVIYNRNHVKHFRTLPWWFKSNILTEFTARELDTSDTSNEPRRKKKKFDTSENDLDDSILDEEFGSLAEFCEDTRIQVTEVYSISQKIENRLRAQQLENTLLEEKLKSALLDKI